MAQTKKMNQSVFADIIKKLTVAGEMIRTHEEEKQSVMDEYLKELKPTPKFFLPRVKSIFGAANMILPDQHISGRQVFNIVRSLSDRVWCHLFRETAAADIIRQDPTIIGAFKVMRRLDLESYQTGFNYLKRFAADVINRTEEGDELKR